MQTLTLKLQPPMPQDYTVTTDPMGVPFCMWTDQGGIRVIPGGKITIHVDGMVVPWNGEPQRELTYADFKEIEPVEILELTTRDIEMTGTFCLRAID